MGKQVACNLQAWMFSMLIASMLMRQAPCQMHAACEGEIIIAAPGKADAPHTHGSCGMTALADCNYSILYSYACAFFVARQGGCVVCSYCSRGTSALLSPGGVFFAQSARPRTDAPPPEKATQRKRNATRATPRRSIKAGRHQGWLVMCARPCLRRFPAWV